MCKHTSMLLLLENISATITICNIKNKDAWHHMTNWTNCTSHKVVYENELRYSGIIVNIKSVLYERGVISMSIYQNICEYTGLKQFKMSFSSGVLVIFRIWLARLFGFQTLKLNGKFSKNETPARYYSLLLTMLIVILEGRYLTVIIIDAFYGHFLTETKIALVILSLTRAITAILAILSDSFIHADKKVNLYNNFQKINDIFLKERFIMSTVLCHTNNAFVILFTLKVFHSAFFIWSIELDIYIIYVLFRKIVISLMTLQILTEICTCESHVKCIRNKILWSHSQQISTQTEIDFRASSFSSKERKVKKRLKQNHNSATKVEMKVYALINENLKLISKIYKNAVTTIYYTQVWIKKSTNKRNKYIQNINNIT